MNTRWTRNTGVLVTALFSTAAFAASSSSKVTTSSSPVPAAPSSTAEVKGGTSGESKKLPIGLSTLSLFTGPRVNQLSNSETTDDSLIGATTGLTLRNQISLSYKFDSQTSLTPVLDFDYQLADPTPEQKALRQFRWRDGFLKLSRSGLISADISGNKLSLDGNLRYYVPMSKGSRDSNSIGSVRLNLNPSLQFANSNFSITMDNYIRQWLQTQDTDAAGNALPNTSLYTGPQLNYAFSDSITAFVLYETSVVWDSNGLPTNVTAPKASQSDVEPGVDVKVHDRVTLTPYLNWYTNQPVHTTTVNLNAAITLL